ncbi:MAG: glycosyltransferase [Acetatifactor muris]|nr:glycosyltransferase [Acetatifactor muris]MCM1526651.1 glycosyltransferase [Bacteroides sp.]
MEKISIVLPCYNHAEYVGDSIRSVLNQTYENFELFVFDNGSADNSWEVINSFEDPRMIKIRLEQNDMLEVKKQFIERATAKYFAIMYSDDLWMETKLEKQMQMIGETGAKVCFTWSKFVNEDLEDMQEVGVFFNETNKSQKEWWEAFFTRANHLSCPSFLCERDIYIRHFGKLYPYRQIADFYCWMKILEETNLYIVEEVLVNQRLHIKGNNPNECARTKENIYRENVELRYVIYKIIDEMPDAVFINNFCEDVKEVAHIDVMCRKFLFFLNRKKGFSEEYDNATRYYNTYFDYEEEGQIFYRLLESKYGFSRNDFFGYTCIRDDMFSIIESRCGRWEILENTDLSTLEYPDKISLYGFGAVGRSFYQQIKEYCAVEQFIDRQPQCASFEGVPLHTLPNAVINADTFIIVIPTYDFEKIVEEIKEMHPAILEENIVKFEDFVGEGKAKRYGF